jgi:hypothetical protein
MIKSARKNGGTLCAGRVVQFARNNHVRITMIPSADTIKFRFIILICGILNRF